MNNLIRDIYFKALRNSGENIDKNAIPLPSAHLREIFELLTRRLNPCEKDVFIYFVREYNEKYKQLNADIFEQGFTLGCRATRDLVFSPFEPLDKNDTK